MADYLDLYARDAVTALDPPSEVLAWLRAFPRH